jgi:hypothetical protein
MISTNFARVTLSRQAGREGLRLDVVSNAEDPAELRAQAQRDPAAERVADHLGRAEEQIAILAASDIYLRGSAASPSCSVTLPVGALQGKDDDFVAGLEVTADNIVHGVLLALLGTDVTRDRPSN